jgi:hypothetical protein
MGGMAGLFLRGPFRIELRAVPEAPCEGFAIQAIGVLAGKGLDWLAEEPELYS